MKSEGVKSPFFVGCHCSDNSGSNACKELVFETCLPSHGRQPLPREARLAMDASHTWSGATGHNHQALNLAPKVKSQGLGHRSWWGAIACTDRDEIPTPEL